MTNVAKTASNGTAPGTRIHFWCPGCNDVHGIVVNAPASWTWNDDLEHPTFDPSILVHPHKTFINGDLEGDSLMAPENITETHRCHSYVRDGRIEFLSDCTHELTGQTVDLPPWPHDQADR